MKKALKVTGIMLYSIFQMFWFATVGIATFILVLAMVEAIFFGKDILKIIFK